MSQELAQDEHEADAEDYEIDSLERGTHQRLGTANDDYEEQEEGGNKGLGIGGVREENVVFQMGEDSDDEEEGKYKDARRDEGGRRRSGSDTGSEDGIGGKDGENDRLR